MYHYLTIIPGKLCEIHAQKELEIQYETLREAVGGYIEAVYFNVNGTKVVCWVDEEGALRPNTPSIMCHMGVLMGPCCITALSEDEDGENTVGFSEAKANEVKAYFDQLCIRGL